MTVLTGQSAARLPRPNLPEGAEVRLVARPPTAMVMLDRRVAMIIPRGGDHPGESAWVVRGDGLIQPLCALFDTYWQLAQGVPTAQDPGSGPTGEDRMLLNLLARGLKDEAMAHQLGVSVRTIRRRVSELTRRLGGTSRFQIGVLAERRGWLETHSTAGADT